MHHPHQVVLDEAGSLGVSVEYPPMGWLRGLWSSEIQSFASKGLLFRASPMLRKSCNSSPTPGDSASHSKPPEDRQGPNKSDVNTESCGLDWSMASHEAWGHVKLQRFVELVLGSLYRTEI